MSAEIDNSLKLTLQKRSVIDALRERAITRNKNGIVYYQPHRKQDLFHKAGEYRFRYVRTGNRFGKSLMGAAEDVAWALGERPWYAENDPARYAGIPRRSVKGLILCQDWGKAEEIFTSQVEGQGKGKLMQLIPQDAFEGVELGHGGRIEIVKVKSRWGGTSVIRLDTVQSFKLNKLSQESSDWDFIHVDEPIPNEMWIANSRGLIDRGGKAWFTCTPLKEMWINDMFIDTKRIRDDFNEPGTRANFWWITGSVRDNVTMSESNIQDFAATLTDAQRAARIEGRPSHMANVIYTEFDSSVHIYREAPYGWKAINEPPENYTIRVAIDPHPRTPHAVLFAATSPFNTTYFFHEIFDHCFTQQLCESIKAGLNNVTPFSTICDPIAWIENPNDGTTMADDFFKYGVNVDKAPKDLARGILATGLKLKERDIHGRPTMLFSEMLVKTLHEFDRYVWDEDKDRPDPDCSDHMMENLYRLVVNGLDYVKPAEVVVHRHRPITMNLQLPGRNKVKKRSFYRAYA